MREKLKKRNRKGVKEALFWPRILIIFTIIFAILSTISLYNAIDRSNKKLKFNEIGNIDYKVYLKDNDFYEVEYLDKGMKYIASIIDKVKINFNYEMHTTEELAYNYKYKIISNLVVTDKNDSNKVLYEKPGVLLKETTESLTDNEFTINKEIEIDYDEYNNYIKDFEKEYNLNASSNLIVTLDVDVDGKHETDNLIRNNQLKIIIPMSEQTIDIMMDAQELNNQGVLRSSSLIKILNYELFITGTIAGIIALVLLIIIFSLRSKAKKDIYLATINKILKEYDRIIVNSEKINEIDFENIIVVKDIGELVDAHDTTKQPILYYEIIPNEKSYFMIIDNKTLYKLSMTRSDLEHK